MDTKELQRVLYKGTSCANTCATRIYDIIREVGNGYCTADNALHKLIEDYQNLKELAKELLYFAGELNGLKSEEEAGRK